MFDFTLLDVKLVFVQAPYSVWIQV